MERDFALLWLAGGAGQRSVVVAVMPPETPMVTPPKTRWRRDRMSGRCRGEFSHLEDWTIGIFSEEDRFGSLPSTASRSFASCPRLSMSFVQVNRLILIWRG